MTARKAPKPRSGNPAPTWSTPEADWRSKVQVAYQIYDPGGETNLDIACTCMARMREAQALIARDGLLVQGPTGPRAHPALAVERDSRIALMRALKALNLDTEAGRDAPGRPPTLHGGY